MSRAILLAVALLPALAFAEKTPVTLGGALKLAAAQSPELAVARAQAQVVQAGVQRAYTAWQPDLVATATYDHTSAPQQFKLGDLVGLNALVFGLPVRNPAAIPGPVDLLAADSASGVIQLTQPLFSPQGLFLPSAARAGAEAAQLGTAEAREQLLLGTARAFLSAAAVRELLAAAQDAERTALSRETEAQQRLEAGTGLPIELSRARSQTAQARAQLAALQGTARSLEATLQQLTGREVTIDPREEDLFGPPGTPAEEPWTQSFAVQAARAQVEAARKLTRFDSFAWLPTLAGVARGAYNTNTGFSGKHTSYDLIVTASLPLYDRGTRYAARAEDEAKLAAAEAGLAAAQARARAAWESAQANLSAAEAALVQAQATLTLAEQARSQVEAARQTGSSTNLELAEADSQRFLAASALAQARATVQIRKVEIAASEGRLARVLGGN